MKKILIFTLVLSSLSAVASANCLNLEKLVNKKFSKVDLYQCKKSQQEFGQLFDEDLDEPGSIEVPVSEACIALGRDRADQVIPAVLAQDKKSGFGMIKFDTTLNSLLGSTLTASLIDNDKDTVTRVDFNLENKIAHFTHWEMGWLGNTMLYNYTVECQKMNKN